MELTKYNFSFLLQILLCASFQASRAEGRLRLKRQAGYVYDRPAMSFDLPSQPTAVSTQAPNVDRTLEQQMYYAYPAPSGGNSATNSQTAGTTSTSTSGATSSATAGAVAGSSASAGYNYGTSNTAGGYNYEKSSSATQDGNSGSQNTLSGLHSSSAGSVSSGSGYGYNAPSPAQSQSLQNSPEVSTSAPRYLPPKGSGEGVSIGSVSITAGSGQINTGSSSSIQTGSTASGGVPFDQYLPPLSTSGQVTSGYSAASQTSSSGSAGLPSDQYLPPLRTGTSSGQSGAPTSIGGQRNVGGLGSIPSSGYLSPNPLPSASLPTPGVPGAQARTAPTQNYLPPSSGPAVPTQNYLPPSSSGARGTVSAPASSYIPPVF